MARRPRLRTPLTADRLRQLQHAGEVELGESRWPPVLAVLTAAVLYATLPDKFISGSGGGVFAVARWIVPALALALLAPLALSVPAGRFVHPERLVPSVPRRTAALALIAVISAANAASIVLLVHFILVGRKLDGHELILASIRIWWTNVIVFALWFWQLDSGGPLERRRESGRAPDFLFAQTATPGVGPESWQPGFLDYLYVSFTNSTAFSPTDTLPLTQWAKMLMLVESGASLLTILMVAARAVNILH